MTRTEAVTVVQKRSIEISLAGDTISIEPDNGVPPNRHRLDFAAWLMLPIAMRRGVDLHVEGAGSEATVRNANRLAEIWSRWLPRHFKPIKTSFAEHWSVGQADSGHGDLCLYSGGVDSTYALLKRFRAGHRQSLLTVHGMEYRHADQEGFEALLAKTSPFAALVGDRRLLIRTNAKEVYKRHRVNPNKESDIGHSFLLAAATFLHSESFGRAVIAADYRRDQQFEVFPWGTNAATNPCFDDGVFALHTESEDVSRAEKCEDLLSCPEALISLTFCVDRAARPHNCGRCQKCIRTKAMFVAATGRLPPLCADSSLGPDCLQAFDLRRRHQRAFFFDLYETARRRGSVDSIPGLEPLYRMVSHPTRTAWLRYRLAKLFAS